MKQKENQVLYWEGVPKTISEYVDLRKRVKEFKSDKIINVLENYGSSPYRVGKNERKLF